MGIVCDQDIAVRTSQPERIWLLLRGRLCDRYHCCGGCYCSHGWRGGRCEVGDGGRERKSKPQVVVAPTVKYKAAIGVWESPRIMVGANRGRRMWVGRERWEC